MLFYRAAVDLSRSTLNYVAGMIRRHRKAIGSPWRLLNPGQQALLVLVYLRKGETFTELGAGFRGIDGDRVAVRGGDRRAAVGALAQARPGAAQGQEGRAALPGPGRHADPHRPGQGRPARTSPASTACTG